MSTAATRVRVVENTQLCVVARIEYDHDAI